MVYSIGFIGDSQKVTIFKTLFKHNQNSYIYIYICRCISIHIYIYRHYTYDTYVFTPG